MLGMSRELNAVSARIRRWREQHGGRGRRIPDELWEAAAVAARVDGVDATARALRLNRGRLRAWTDAAGETGTVVPPISPSFVDLGPVSGLGRVAVELTNRRGDRMRIEVTEGLQVLQLARALLEGPQ